MIRKGETEHFSELNNDVWLTLNNIPDWLAVDTKAIAHVLGITGVEYLTLTANYNYRDHDRWYELRHIATRHVPGIRSRSRRGYEVLIYMRNFGIDSHDEVIEPEQEKNAAEQVNAAIKKILFSFANEQLMLLSRSFPFAVVDLLTFSFEVVYLLLMMALMVNMASELATGMPISTTLEKTNVLEASTDYLQYVAFVWFVATAIQIRDRVLNMPADDKLSQDVRPMRFLPNVPLDRYARAVHNIVGGQFVTDLDGAMSRITNDSVRD